LGKTKKVKASLLIDGTGIVITEPSVPQYLYKDLKSMYALDAEAEACEATIRAHKVASTGIKRDEKRQVKQVTVKFPDGMSCNNEFFNNSGTSKLKTNIRFMEVVICQEEDEDGLVNDVNQTCTYVFWKVAIDGTDRRLREESDSDEDELVGALKRMKIKPEVKKASKTNGMSF